MCEVTHEERVTDTPTRRVGRPARKRKAPGVSTCAHTECTATAHTWTQLYMEKLYICTTCPLHCLLYWFECLWAMIEIWAADQILHEIPASAPCVCALHVLIVHLLTLMSFQTCLLFFHGDILKSLFEASILKFGFRKVLFFKEINTFI